MTNQEFFEIIKKFENEKLEFKEAKNGFDFDHKNGLLDYIVAIGNGGVGKLILGVSNKMPRTVLGTSSFPNVAKMTNQVFEKIKIRVRVEEMFIDKKRILIIDIPKRPIGSLFKFSGIPRMRVGETIRDMTEEEIKMVYREIETDFSSEIVSGLKIEDLNQNAIKNLRAKWSEKSGRKEFLSFDDQKTLESLGLLNNGKLNYASLILLGKKDKLDEFLPCSEIIFEWRQEKNNINHDFRVNFREGLFNIFDDLWSQINARNLRIPFQEGLIQREIFAFSEKPVREAILNAVAHRDYRISSRSIFIRANPEEFEIESPGGLLQGITIDNILTQSAWRNRRLMDVLEKTGLVERSGQGMDDIFGITIREGKGMPDLKSTTDISVILKIPARVKDKKFILFLEKIANEKQIRFSFEEIYELEKIREGGIINNVPFKNKFLDLGIIEKIGVARGTKYILSHKYYTYEDRPGLYTKISGISRNKSKELILSHIKKNKEGGKMKDFKDAFPELKPMDLSNILRELRAEGRIAYKGHGIAGAWFMVDN